MAKAKVELVDVALNRCSDAGLRIETSSSKTTVVATRCEFSNSDFGARVQGSLTSATFNNCVKNSEVFVFVMKNLFALNQHFIHSMNL